MPRSNGSMGQVLSWALASGPKGPQPDWNVTVAGTEAAGALAEARADDFAALSETELVAACLAARPGAFDLVVERHRRQVYQLCYRFVNNHEDASDLSQDVFIRAYRGLKNFKGQSSLATWLYRIGVNVCLNRVSAKQHPLEPIETQRDLGDGAESASEKLLRDERAARVREAIARLPKKQRAALVLRMYQELSHQEIARMLGSSVGAVKANVFHALQNLKRLLPTEDL